MSTAGATMTAHRLAEARMESLKRNRQVDVRSMAPTRIADDVGDHPSASTTSSPARNTCPRGSCSTSAAMPPTRSHSTRSAGRSTPPRTFRSVSRIGPGTHLDCAVHGAHHHSVSMDMTNRHRILLRRAWLRPGRSPGRDVHHGRRRALGRRPVHRRRQLQLNATERLGFVGARHLPKLERIRTLAPTASERADGGSLAPMPQPLDHARHDHVCAGRSPTSWTRGRPPGVVRARRRRGRGADGMRQGHLVVAITPNAQDVPPQVTGVLFR